MVVGSGSDEPPPPGTEERLTKFTELVATAIANAEAQAELTASRARIVATADETRRRIERDLHDGAQQRLVTLALRLRAAQAAVPPDLDELDAELDAVARGLGSALDELREFARGIHPAILAEGGLAPALKALARRSAIPVELDVRVGARLPEPIEVGAYYVVSEALANVAKHAEASVVSVDVDAQPTASCCASASATTASAVRFRARIRARRAQRPRRGTRRAHLTREPAWSGYVDRGGVAPDAQARLLARRARDVGRDRVDLLRAEPSAEGGHAASAVRHLSRRRRPSTASAGRGSARPCPSRAPRRACGTRRSSARTARRRSRRRRRSRSCRGGRREAAVRAEPERDHLRRLALAAGEAGRRDQRVADDRDRCVRERGQLLLPGDRAVAALEARSGSRRRWS